MIELVAAVALKMTLIDGAIPYTRWPYPCSERVCVLTGNSAVYQTWLRHVDANRNKVFVVKGRCSSACEIAYRKAMRLGCTVIVAPGARLVPHRRSRVNLD